uniref:Uncharacterized protein n=1 Tax=Arundo donax TaxID=35708 RepID=A0A0A8ZTU7_ARUDO
MLGGRMRLNFQNYQGPSNALSSPSHKYKKTYTLNLIHVWFAVIFSCLAY